MVIFSDCYIIENIMQEKIKELQIKAATFLKSYSLLVNGMNILLKEVEVYYYEKSVFEDYTVPLVSTKND